MYLSSLDIFGFKSFAQRIHINFAPGLTAIVGPNGCGKSNIVDAVRWVLGEQREAALRSERMENVIFSGTGKRRALGMAEISLTLHDPDGILPVEYEEVTVTRRLFRSGKSEYLLNKTACRLRDLVDLFMGTGVGPDAYSIIELKMVEDILSENPDETRRLLDEALGITRYKQRRKEALRRLADARLDRDRALDILNEVDHQGKALKRQVGRVKAYKKLQEKASRVRAALVLLQVKDLEAQLQPLAGLLTAHKVDLELQTGQLSSAEADLMRIEAEMLQSENARQTISRDYEQAQQRYQGLAAELAKTEEDLRAANWQLERNRAARQKIEAELLRLAEMAAQAQAELQESEGQLPVIKTQHDEQRQLFAAADAAFRMARSASQDGRQTISDLRDQQAQAIRAAEQRAALQASLQERQTQIQTRKAELQRQLEENQDSLASLKTVLKDKTARLEQTRRRFQEVDAQIAALQDQIRGVERALDQNEASRRQIVVQLEHLSELHRRSSPLFAAGGSLAQRFPKQISGALADELQVDERFILAIESALQGMVYSRVLESESALDAVLEYLAREKPGRAALLVGSPPSSEFSSARQFASEHEGRALAELIESDSPPSAWVRHLLRRTVLVGSRHELQRLAASALRENLTLVSAAGEFTDGQGIWILGAARDEAPRVVALSTRRASLERQRDEADAEIERIRLKLQDLRETLTQAGSDYRGAETERSQAEQNFDAANRQMLQMEAQVVSADLLHEQFARELIELEGRLTHLPATLPSDAAQIPDLEARLASLQENQRRQEDSEAKALEERERIRGELESAQLALERAASARERIHVQVRQLQERSQELLAEKGVLTEDDQNSILRLERLQMERQSQVDIVAEASLVLTQFREKLEAFDSSRLELNETQRNARNGVRDQRSRIEQITQEIHRLQLQSVEWETSLREERKKLEGLDLGGLDEEPADAEILAKIERKIISLEPLNLAAEKEYQELEERQNFLSSQLQDLDQAQADLQETVATLNREAKERFESGFGRIRDNFQRIFTTVFEGGSTDLRLAADDPLEADVELLAAPPGKRMGALTLLSGGEKALTAISLLFAIYLEKPSPFCILDEVDAPLDDENTRRFCRLLHSFTAKTQFLVITHNKRTMTEAQQLLGVTMEEEGVSKVVPVKLN